MRFFCIPMFACQAGASETLDFSQKRLDEVPREVLKARKHIEELLLNVNSIEALPIDLFRCTKIRRLDISENKIKMLPSEICQLQLLTELNLSKNEVVEIPEEIGTCHSLASLDISTNIVPALPKSIVNLTSLTSLNVSNNSLTQLPHDIDRLINLQYLDLAQCELRALPASVVRLQKLRVLDLCDNSLTELPSGMDGLVSLELLDLHENQIGELSEDLLRCYSLKTIDLSGNHLTFLPSNFGDLTNLVEVTLCANLISSIPHSVGQLKKLEILKSSKNRLIELTPAICSCSLLTDLILCENQLHELPSSLGNLRRLKFLDVSVNNLRNIPTTIGGCSSLGVLSLRHNHLKQLPMDIGRLERLQVLDVIDNDLTFLPYTLTVLYKNSLTAIWLSFSQPPMPKFTTINDPVTNIKVLTCYLLPQKAPKPLRNVPKSCIGGARVAFAQHNDGEMPSIIEDDDDKLPIGRFERYDTPHPKPFAPKNRLNQLQQRNSGDLSSQVLIANGISVAATTSTEQTQVPPPIPATGPPDSARSDLSSASPNVEMRPLRSVLKRRPQSVISQQLFNIADEKSKIMHIQVHRGPNGIEWSISGGVDSPPHKDNMVGIFVSQMNDTGPAKMAGFHVHDKLLSVNGVDLTKLTHNEAVQVIKNAGDRLEFVVERNATETKEATSSSTQYEASVDNLPLMDDDGGSTSPPIRTSPQQQSQQIQKLQHSHHNQQRQSSPPSAMPTIAAFPPTSSHFNNNNNTNDITIAHSIAIRRNKKGALGFTIHGEGGPEDPVRIKAISPDGSAEGRVLVGDRLVGIDGTDVKYESHEKIVSLLSGQPNTTIQLAVERRTMNRSDNVINTSLPPPMAQSGFNSANHKPSTAQQAQLCQHPSKLPLFFGSQKSRQGASHVQQTTNAPVVPFKAQQQHNALECGDDGATTTTATAFGEMALWRSMPSLVDAADAVPAPAGGRKVLPPLPPPRPEKKTTTFSAKQHGTGGFHRVGSERVGHHATSMASSVSASNLLLMMLEHKSEAEDRPPLPPKGPSLSMRMANPKPPVSQKLKETTLASGAINSLASSTVLNKKQTSSSGIPVPQPLAMPAQSNGLINDGKPPPPVAPKPKIIAPEKLAFTSKLQNFERQIQQQKPIAPSGIPLKKPLVSGSDLMANLSSNCNNDAKLKTATGSAINDDGNDDGALLELAISNRHNEFASQLLLSPNSYGAKNSGSSLSPSSNNSTGAALPQSSSSYSSHLIPPAAGPSIIRTKKAELRANRRQQSDGELAADDVREQEESLENGNEVLESSTVVEDSAKAGGDGSGSSSLLRASSSLSQRASELEKRQAWRQARLQSMDVESKRTDELVKLITTASPIPT